MSCVKNFGSTVRGLLTDVRGLASVEATILLAVLGVGIAAAGYTVGPAVKSYADKVTATVREARCLAAGDPAAPFPTNCPIAN